MESIGSSLRYNSALVIDTNPPTVTKVMSTPVKQLTSGTFGVGEEIFISVVFSHSVTVSLGGSTDINTHPYIKLETGNINRKAYYNRTDGLTNSVIFKYTVQNGDQTPDLDYFSTTALVIPSPSYIRRTSTSPTTPVDPTFVAPAMTNSLADSGGIVIDTTSPKVDKIIASQPPGNHASALTGNVPLAAGDEILLEVFFNYPVTVNGSPKIYVNTAASNPEVLEYVIAAPEGVSHTFNKEMAEPNSPVFIIIDFEFTGSLALNEYVEIYLPSFGQIKPSDVPSLSINATHPTTGKGLPFTAGWDVSSSKITLTATSPITSSMAPSTYPITYPTGISVRLTVDAKNAITSPSQGVRKGDESGIYLTTNAVSGPITTTSTYNKPSTILTGIGISSASISSFTPAIAGYATEIKLNFVASSKIEKNDKIEIFLPYFDKNVTHDNINVTDYTNTHGATNLNAR